MQENEQLARLKRQRFKEVLATAVQNFDGKLLQNYGDGALTDQEFCDAYNDRDPAKVLALSSDILSSLAKQAGSRPLAAVCVFEHA